MGIWKTIKGGWEVLKDRTRFKVGSDNRVKFWINKWCEDTLLRKLFSALYSISSSKDAWVVDVWDGGSQGLRLLDNYMTRNSRRWMYSLGDCMTNPLRQAPRILWCGWGQRRAAS